jgi:hypothetical protein
MLSSTPIRYALPFGSPAASGAVRKAAAETRNALRDPV